MIVNKNLRIIALAEIINTKIGRFWTGDKISELTDNQIFVFGSNPEGRHGKGAAKQAMEWGAIYGKGRGLQGRAYALVTKNLTVGYVEEATGIKYRKYGGVKYHQLVENIQELYACARNLPDMDFLVPYKVGDNNLNGYSTEMLMCAFKQDKPDNVILHESVEYSL
jgi:hypothetical protein